MCGGVIFPFRQEYRQVLQQVYSPEEVELFERTGYVRSLYWQKGDPVLPVIMDGQEDELNGHNGDERNEHAGVTIMRWGNRDKASPFPQTGWARVDSIYAGKWDYLKPSPVLILVTYGVEKGKWFKINNGIRGVVVRRGGDMRAYMLTDQAVDEYLDMTGHARMPVLVDQTDFGWIGADPLAQFMQGKSQAQQSS